MYFFKTIRKSILLTGIFLIWVSAWAGYETRYEGMSAHAILTKGVLPQSNYRIVNAADYQEIFEKHAYLFFQSDFSQKSKCSLILELDEISNHEHRVTYQLWKEKEYLGELIFEENLSPPDLSTDTHSHSSKDWFQRDSKRPICQLTKGPYAGERIAIEASTEKLFGFKNGWDLDFTDPLHGNPAVREYISELICSDPSDLPRGEGYCGKIVSHGLNKIVSRSWISDEDLKKLRTIK